MTNLSKFSERKKMAWEKAKKIFAVSRKNGTVGRQAWYEAIRMGWKLVKALYKGEVSFWTMKGKTVTRKIEAPQTHDVFIKDDLVRLWDTVKMRFVCFHTFQIW